MELTTQAEQVTKKTEENRTEERTREPVDVELVTQEQEDATEASVEMISVGASNPKEEKASSEGQGEKQEMESKPFYELKAALTAMWLPAVVGDKRKMFIAASLSTLITKILMLLLSVILVYFFQEKVHSHPFVLWSKVGKSPNLLLANQVPILLLFKSARQI